MNHEYTIAQTIAYLHGYAVHKARREGKASARLVRLWQAAVARAAAIGGRV